jgi:hypothetical protein
MTGVIRGAIVLESLKAGTVIEGYDLRVTRISRYRVGEPAQWQPSTWTLLEFEAAEDDSDALAQRLCKDLDEPGWYANWYSKTQAIVVFPEKVFRYKRGSRAGRAKAQKYARDCGVPDTQLDWDD